ncbi:MAG: class I SAM-dependent methyltransferase [Desulfobacterales bacterium]|nr:class I SAM-dependent methyltransferase [Desulfobacterales bacterium]
MNSVDTFQVKSYKQHADHFQAYGQGGVKAEHAKTWLTKGTVDAWRHQRIYQTLEPILTAEPDAKWLTVGDGRFGKDAKYIATRGGDVLATDISEVLLKEAKKIGYISDYKVENAELLSFKDAVFDYVLCKDSYHHFPRPMLALYEMLRVARKGVLLIEPNDAFITDRFCEIFFRKIKNGVKFLLRRKAVKDRFEESGNYIYSISRRELEKVAIGLNYKFLAFKGINDVYLAGVEYENFSDKGPLQKKTRRLIALKNLFSRFGLINYGLLAAVILKGQSSEKVLQELKKEGYDIVSLPENPHILD